MQLDSGMSLYEGCRAELREAKKLDAIAYNIELSKIEKWVEQHSQHKYFMLLCNELRYYTVFNIHSDNLPRFIVELQECINYRGEVLKIEPADSKQSAYEIWIRDNEDNEPHVFMLFEYGWGVIEVE